MGFADLRLAAPRSPDMTQDPQAIALASGATDILDSVRQSPALDGALEGVTLAFALTARARDLGPPTCDIRQASALAHQHLLTNRDNRVAIVLGCERAGLSNEEVALCQRVCHIPANPAYSSLNVAQALQLAAWELRYALLDNTPGLPSTPALSDDPGKAPATNEAVQRLLVHWEQALAAVEFLDPAHPKKLMVRMRYLLGRHDMTRDEVHMLRGVCTAMIKTAKRANEENT